MKTDASAINYLSAKHKLLQFPFKNITLNLESTLSKAFKYYFSEAKRLKTEE
jgi:hypothetical protein